MVTGVSSRGGLFFPPFHFAACPHGGYPIILPWERKWSYLIFPISCFGLYVGASGVGIADTG